MSEKENTSTLAEVQAQEKGDVLMGSIRLYHGVGVRCNIWRFGPRWETNRASLPRKIVDGSPQYIYEKKGTIFYINETATPNLWFHVSFLASGNQKDGMSSAILMANYEAAEVARELDFEDGVVMPIEDSWKFITTYMSMKAVKASMLPFSFPGELTKADLKHFAGQYPGAKPRPVPLDQGFNEELKAKIIAIIKKYDDWSFAQLCEEIAAHDATCSEEHSGKIDDCDPECCPVKDFRELVRILCKAMPHEKIKTPYGHYY